MSPAPLGGLSTRVWSQAAGSRSHSAARTSERSAADVGRWDLARCQRFCSTQRDCALSSRVPSADYGSAVMSKQEMVFPKLLPSCWKSCRQNGYNPPPSDCGGLCCLSAGLYTVDVHLYVQRNLEEMQTIQKKKNILKINLLLSLSLSLNQSLKNLCDNSQRASSRDY